MGGGIVANTVDDFERSEVRFGERQTTKGYGQSYNRRSSIVGSSKRPRHRSIWVLRPDRER